MRKLIYILSTLLLITVSFSCNEDEWLKEEPLDFRTTSNSYEKPDDFEVAVNELYAQFRDDFYFTGWIDFYYQMYFPTDQNWDAIGQAHNLNDYTKLVPEAHQIEYWWNFLYSLTFNSNVVTSRIDDEGVTFDSESQRNRLIAEARFFRAWSYRTLGILYGGVPVVTQEFTEPKRDFERNSEAEVWDQCIADLEYAVQHLPTVDERKADGRLTKAAARHLLTEVYITAEEYTKAINTATNVIDDPNYALMTERFGTRQDEPGDVYWDLFRRGNQNRSASGNTEAILVAQFEHNLDGGGGVGTVHPRTVVTNYRALKDDNGDNLFTGPLDYLGGRGIGWLGPSEYMTDIIWERSGWNEDIRNSEHNFIRDPKANNPDSEYYGEGIISSGAIEDFKNTLRRFWSPIPTKVAPVGNFPPETIEDPETGLTNNGAAYGYKDEYIFRLAETYLLRAEAHLKNGDPGSAANDINVVRDRVQAPPVSQGEVDMDYILDERCRELLYEEWRQLTLRRTDTWYERTKQYNPVSGPTIREHHSLWPIPASEIERNTEHDLEQNPGY